MKKLKKLLSIVLAVAMVMSLAVSVTAVDTTTYTITINNDTTGYSYSAYQIFAGTLSDGVLSDIVWGSGVDTTKQNSNSQDIFTALSKITLDNGTSYPFTDVNGNPLTSAADVAAVLSDDYASTSSTDLAEAFAKVIADFLSTTKYDSVDNTTSDSNYTIEVTGAGYYLIMNTSVAETVKDGAYTEYILKVVKNTEATPKEEVPSLDKTVADVNDSNGTTTQGDTDTADYDIGDDVPFTLTASLPSNYSLYTEYALTFHDDLSTNLSFNNDVEVAVYNVETGLTVGGSWGSGDYYTYSNGVWTKVDTSTGTVGNDTYYTKTVVKNSNGGYTTTSTSLTDGCDFEVVITDTNSLSSDMGAITVSATSKIVVTYTAKLGDSASYSETNSSYITYSNDPYGTGTGTSTTDTNTVYTYKLVVTKMDGDKNEALAGADFTLYKLVSISAFDSGTKYYTYTSADGWKEVDTSGGATPVDGTDYYIIVDTIEADDATGSPKNTYTFTSLDDGDYVLVESNTPTGFNTISDVYFTVEATHNESGGVTELVIKDSAGNTISTGSEATFSVTASSGEIATTINNYTGETLPETGGIGVTIFYVVGGILILAAAGVIVISKKRRTEK